MGAGALETKEASASQEGDNLKANKAMAGFVSSLVTKTTGEEAQPACADEKGKETSESEACDRGLTEKEASASEACDRGLKRKEAIPPEDFGILEKKKVMTGLRAVFRSRLAKGKEAQPSEAGKGVQLAEAGKKRTKVVKKELTQKRIEVMRAMPIERIEITQEHLLYSSQLTLSYYEWNNAAADYEDALIRQYDLLGYAEDETDVTEEEMVEKQRG